MHKLLKKTLCDANRYPRSAPLLAATECRPKNFGLMDDERLTECADALIEAARAWLVDSADVDLSLGISFSRKALRDGCFAAVPVAECERIGLLEKSGRGSMYKLSRPVLRRLHAAIKGNAASCPISMNDLEPREAASPRVGSPPTLARERSSPPLTSAKHTASTPLGSRRVQPRRRRGPLLMPIPPGFDAVFGVPLLQEWSIRMVDKAECGTNLASGTNLADVTNLADGPNRIAGQRVGARPNLIDGPRLALSGRVYCRPDFVEGTPVDTSVLERVEGRRVWTLNSAYYLGSPLPEAVAEILRVTQRTAFDAEAPLGDGVCLGLPRDTPERAVDGKEPSPRVLGEGTVAHREVAQAAMEELATDTVAPEAPAQVEPVTTEQGSGVKAAVKTLEAVLELDEAAQVTEAAATEAVEEAAIQQAAAEKAAAEKAAAEKAAAEKAAAEKAAAEKAAAQKAAAKKTAAEKTAAEKTAAEKTAAEKAAAMQHRANVEAEAAAETERLAALETKRLAALAMERLAALEMERLAALETERLAALEAERLAAAEAVKASEAAAAEAEVERLAAVAADRVAAEQAAAEQAAAEQAAAKQAVAEQAAAEQAAAEQAAAEQAAAEQAAAEQAAAEQAAAEKLATHDVVAATVHVTLQRAAQIANIPKKLTDMVDTFFMQAESSAPATARASAMSQLGQASEIEPTPRSPFQLRPWNPLSPSLLTLQTNETPRPRMTPPAPHPTPILSETDILTPIKSTSSPLLLTFTHQSLSTPPPLHPSPLPL